MTNIVDYFRRLHELINDFSGVEVERYEEQVLTARRGNLRIRLRLPDNSLLEISESVQIRDDTFQWISYRYHYQDSIGNLIFRYDNAPHHPEIKTHPDHKHISNGVLDSLHPHIESVLKEIKEHLTEKIYKGE